MYLLLNIFLQCDSNRWKYICKINYFLSKFDFVKKYNRPWQDSNLQSSDPKSDALSIRPHGRKLQKDNQWSVFLFHLSNDIPIFFGKVFPSNTKRGARQKGITTTYTILPNTTLTKHGARFLKLFCFDIL